MLLAALLAGCPKSAPVPPAPSAEARVVDELTDLAGAAGVRATVTGTLARRRPDAADADGTAIVLADGTAVYVTEGAPPEGWEWLLGTAIRVQGTLWEEAPDGWPVPKLLAPEAPMPADVGMGI